MSLTERLTELVSACFTGLWIERHEHDDALAEIAKCAANITGDLPSGISNRA